MLVCILQRKNLETDTSFTFSVIFSSFYTSFSLSLPFSFLPFLSSLQLSQLIVNAGGVAAIVDYLGDTQGNVRLPGVMMLGYVAAHSESLAMAVIVSKVRRCCKLFIAADVCQSCHNSVQQLPSVEERLHFSQSGSFCT